MITLQFNANKIPRYCWAIYPHNLVKVILDYVLSFEFEYFDSGLRLFLVLKAALQ